MHLKNTFLKITAAAAAFAVLSGCGVKPTEQSVSENTEIQTSAEVSAETTEPIVTEETEQEIDYSTLSEEEIRQLIIDRSLMTLGDTSRVEAALRKAENGEEITVAYIGGSITEGLTAGPDNCWAKLSYDWLCGQYPDAKINYVNAGMSGTPSILGAVRAERDVVSPYGGADIVFVEFAVNDGQEQMYKECYESLVKGMLNLDEDTAVVLLFTVLKNKYSCQPHMSEVGENYSLPMISVGDAINPEIDEGRMTWEDYSDDESHPNYWGHQLVCDFITNYFEKVIEGMGEAKPINDISGIEPVFGDRFTKLHILDSSNLTPVSVGEYTEKQMLSQFPNSWMRRGGENLGISFEITCKDLFVIYHCQNSARYATADVYIDGEKVDSVKSGDESGWGNPAAQLVYSGSEVKTHTVELKMAEGHEDNYFGLLGFGYSD